MRDKLEKVLISAARRNPPDARVPYGFEQRVLAAIRAQGPIDPWLAWNWVMTRAACFCAMMSVVVGLWWFCAAAPEPASIDLEHTVLAALDHTGGTW